jgi:hypothetical protein
MESRSQFTNEEAGSQHKNTPGKGMNAEEGVSLGLDYPTRQKGDIGVSSLSREGVCRADEGVESMETTERTGKTHLLFRTHGVQGSPMKKRDLSTRIRPGRV